MSHFESFTPEQATIYHAHLGADSAIMRAMAGLGPDDREVYDVLNHLTGDNVATCAERLSLAGYNYDTDEDGFTLYDEVAKAFAEAFVHDWPALDRRIKWLESSWGEARCHVAFAAPDFVA